MSEDRAEQIRAALWENRRSPNGALRNARAEELVAQAEGTGDTGLLLETVSQLITSYEYSAERSKMFVPFARMLRMWDEDPGCFDEQMAHELFWRFKWVTGSMIDYPDIPLASIEEWLAEMERRYRLAGYNARTVRAEEFFVARHLGDRARADSAYAAWTAGERDAMSNCHACEAAAQGQWEAEQGHDERALQRWEQVLAGRLTCAEEPHWVLSCSLLPLLRLGRTDEARSNHLRGYHLSRGNESLLSSVARHIEFCALTGNEARGLEILAEHVRHLEGGGNPNSSLTFFGATVLLLDRLRALGLGDQHVAGPQGRTRTVSALRDHCETLRADLATRFDRRNGNDTVSLESAARIAQQPLADRLPLGVTSALPGGLPGALPGVAAVLRPVPTTQTAASSEAVPFEDVLAEARRLRDSGHPTSRQAWLAVEAALGEREPDTLLRAEIAVQRGIRVGRDGASGATADFEEAATAFREAGRPGDAVVNDGRAAIALALAGDGEDALERVDEAVATARAGHAQGRATTRQLAMVLDCRARVLTLQAMRTEDEAACRSAEAALAEVQQVIEAGLAAADGQEPADGRRLLVLLADVHRSRAALVERDAAAATALLRASADTYLRTEQPWNAAEVLIPLARLHSQHGDLAAAEAAAEETLRLGGDHLDADDAGYTRLLLANLLGHRNAHEDAVRHALEAARRLDEAGLGSDAGSAARHRLALSYQALGRHAEAAEVLQSAMPDLLAHGDRAAVAARRALGESLSELREHAEAAEQFALAAQAAEAWGEPYPLAQLASRTAEALAAAGRGNEAEAAYERAQRLWGEAEVPSMVVRTLRARAWETFRKGRSADPGRVLMTQAEQTARDALARPGVEPEDADELRSELVDTWRQLAALLRDVAEDDGWNGAELSRESQRALYLEAWELFRRAADGFAEAGEPGVGRSAQALLEAASVRIEMEQPELATAELKELQALVAEHGERLAAVGARAQSMLDWLERRSAG